MKILQIEEFYGGVAFWGHAYQLKIVVVVNKNLPTSYIYLKNKKGVLRQKIPADFFQNLKKLNRVSCIE